jgi:hypothetical protein
MKKALIASAIALVFPSAAQAGLVTMVSRDVPLGPRVLQSAAAPMRFNMIGVHWQGSGEVDYRTESVRGRWGAWIAADDDSGPDAESTERSKTWRDGNLDWVGASKPDARCCFTSPRVLPLLKSDEEAGPNDRGRRSACDRPTRRLAG